MIHIRPAATEDAPALSALYRDNRPFLAPWEPVRDDSFFTVEGQRQRLQATEVDRRAGTAYRCVIEDGAEIVGMISLTVIERGPAQSANVGYWVARAANGRGVATGALRLMLDLAFGELGLHRLQAGTLLHNLGSQKVLAHNGFERIGLARAYLNIAGQWQDHILFQRIGGVSVS